MKRILGLASVLGLVGVLTVMAQEVKPEKTEVIDLGKDMKFEMVLITAGKFIMGSPDQILYVPQHEVTITKPYYIGKYEVTQELWEAVMGNNPSAFDKGAKLPVADVSWNDCQEFITKLNEKTSGGFRLPTEAEWEYACKAGTSTAYSFGDKMTPKDANYVGSKIGKPKVVGSYKPNAFGLYDMHGNVFEWCEDWYESDNSGGAKTDPKGPEVKGSATGDRRVLRGDSFSSNYLTGFRLSDYGKAEPSFRGVDNGFRLARTADIKARQESVAKAKMVKEQAKMAKEQAKFASIEKEMVLIPAGKFMMGSPESEKFRFGNETQHEVTLTKPFYMGKYEVTQEHWEAVMGDNPSSGIKGSKLPVTNVSWYDCQEFIKELNEKTNGGFRLPTEAEWEYACRAGTTTAFSFGDSLTKRDANIDGLSISGVGSYKPNAFGLYDMHGNVWEWCEDWNTEYPAGAVKDPKAKRPATLDSRVARGGYFAYPSSLARSSYRMVGSTPNARFDFDGFRLARTADIKAAVAPIVIKPDPAVIMPVAGNLLIAPFSEAKAKEVQKEVAKILQKEVEEKVDLGKGLRLDLVLIPTGKFMMGSSSPEKEKLIGQTQHEVTITKPFYIGKYEVTQEQWKSVMEKNPSAVKGVKLPVTTVSWNDCQEFIKKLNARTDGGYRLPTEAEWEYACRAGTTTAFSFGDSLTKRDANINGSSIKGVGSYKPNPFGLYDMHGNVWEWCEDWKADYPVGPVTDPKGSATGEYRILRSGSFFINDSIARSSVRNYYTPATRHFNLGLRLAKDK